MEETPGWFEVKVETTIKVRLSAAEQDALVGATDETEAAARQAAIARVMGALQLALDLDKGVEGGFFKMSSTSTWRTGHWAAPR